MLNQKVGANTVAQELMEGKNFGEVNYIIMCPLQRRLHSGAGLTSGSARMDCVFVLIARKSVTVTRIAPEVTTRAQCAVRNSYSRLKL